MLCLHDLPLHRHHLFVVQEANHFVALKATHLILPTHLFYSLFLTASMYTQDALADQNLLARPDLVLISRGQRQNN